MSKHEKMTDEQMMNSSHELAVKLRTVIEEHFGSIPGLSTFEKGIDDMFVLSQAMMENLAKAAFIFANQASLEKQTHISEELMGVVALYENLLVTNLDTMAELTLELAELEKADRSKFN